MQSGVSGAKASLIELDLRFTSFCRAQGRRHLLLSPRVVWNPADKTPGNITDATLQTSASLDWSTSYQAGSSNSGSAASNEEDFTDVEDESSSRGRTFGAASFPNRLSTVSRNGTDVSQLMDTNPDGLRPIRRFSFTRSRSPMPRTSSANAAEIPRISSPLSGFRTRRVFEYLLPVTIELTFRVPFSATIWTMSLDARKAGECFLLAASLAYITQKLSLEQLPSGIDLPVSTELQLLIMASVTYLIWGHTTAEQPPSDPLQPREAPLQTNRPSSPRPTDSRENKRGVNIPRKEYSTFVWMTVPKNYREASDDGICTALILGPLAASAMLYSSVKISRQPGDFGTTLPSTWLVEPPLALKNVLYPGSAEEALLVSRLNAVNLATLCSTILLIHASASWWAEYRASQGVGKPEGERRSVPRSEGRKWWLYVLFTFSTTMALLVVRALLADGGSPIWQHLNYFEVAVASLFYQFAMYISVRLAHRSFTLGELGLVSFGATALFMEMVNLTIARIWPLTTPYIKTYRLPTPLLIYQIALIAGSLLTGFLLCPLLVLSRRIASQSVRRLRVRQERIGFRRSLALGFYGGAVLIIGGLIGMWTRWCLGNRDPWLYVIFWLLQGRRKWSRPVLLAYWGLLGSISVGNAESFVVPNSLDVSAPSEISTPTMPPSSGGRSFATLPNLPNFPNGAQVSSAATDFLDAADKRVPTLSLNARRKSFHVLAVAMFLPGVAFDPAFTHIAFSAAFALFTFAEYVRFFALYPFGAAVHLFMNEFLDHKDSGTAILSHFYLLTGCAGSVWLEGPTRLLGFTGILVLGVGDAMASIVGKRFGRHRWSATTPKTLEGSAGFTVSVVFCAWLLQMLCLTEHFSYLLSTLPDPDGAGWTRLDPMWLTIAAPPPGSPVELIRSRGLGVDLGPRVMSLYREVPKDWCLSEYALRSGSMANKPTTDAVDVNPPNLAFVPNDLSLSPRQMALSQSVISSPVLPVPSRREGKRPARPSTASSAEGQSTVLPSLIRATLAASEARRHIQNDSFRSDINAPLIAQEAILEADVSSQDGESDRRAGSEDNHQSDLGWLPSPFDPSTSASEEHNDPFDDARSANDMMEADYDWATFIEAYATGRWDPHRTPRPPRSRFSAHFSTPSEPSSSRISLGLDLQRSTSADASAPEPGEQQQRDTQSYADWRFMNSSELDTVGTSLQTSPGSTSGTPPNMGLQSSRSDESVETISSQSTAPQPSASIFSSAVEPPVPPPKARFSAPLTINLPTNRLRNSFADFRALMPSSASDRPPMLSPEIATHTATMRLAAARISLAPLALPSPEHELTDPLRGVNAIIPGSHPLDAPTRLTTAGEARKSRLGSFWQGTQDVDETDQSYPSNSSPSPPVPESTQSDIQHDNHGLTFTLNHLPPATAPVKPHLAEDSDYFGPVGIENIEEKAKPLRTSSLSHARPLVPFERRPSEPAPQLLGVVTVPAVPRRLCLARQTSTPLPNAYDMSLRSARVASDGIPGKAGRAAREERMFEELGYLAPPNPPDELERRRALYQFNIWDTKSDANFDRIVHLAKLVFSTKIVALCLVDGNDLWIKSESGIGKREFYPRPMSFGAHTILQRGDEPTVVLDTTQDWRFAQNPLVNSHPNAKFYAGAPLRTQDGYNIGTLSLMDDIPHRDFSPRQRHTLKEFAAIAMREMELWRDKVRTSKIECIISDRVTPRSNSGFGIGFNTLLAWSDNMQMEHFTRECLEIENESHDSPNELFGAQSMEKIYERAAKLVKRTLDVEHATVMDVSHCEVLETMSAEASVSVVSYSAESQTGATHHQLSAPEYTQLSDFFSRYPDGKISDGIAPPPLRAFLSGRIQYALTVPIFNIDKRPFALLCAYTTSEPKRRYYAMDQLEGHELSYLRAIGVIILSAVLKRRMILADKAKSLFISNISHELRTPLHGILAAAELLADSPLNHSQVSFLQTVRACGTSLVETVNHVLDFTKLSGNTQGGGVENVIPQAKVDVMSLVEEAVEGCWIGYKARMASLVDSEIGSVYSPPKTDDGQAVPDAQAPVTAGYVETVIDIGKRSSGWTLKCEKGGLRRVLMNIFGNSLKFTTDGYVHVVLRQIAQLSDNTVKNQLFHPFSQENPLQTGTGLGLAIVNSIVRSPSFDGNIDVWSAEGVGTEIKITFKTEVVEDRNPAVTAHPDFPASDNDTRRKISLVGFGGSHRGTQLLRSVLSTYIVSWWGFELQADGAPQYGDIVILNEDLSPVISATRRRDTSRAFIVLSSSRGDPQLMAVVGHYGQLGGFCRLVYKPGGPSRLYLALKLCLQALNIAEQPRELEDQDIVSVLEQTNQDAMLNPISPYSSLPRRNSEEARRRSHTMPRPPLGNRANTVHPLATVRSPPMVDEPEATPSDDPISPLPSGDEGHETSNPTIAIGNCGTLLKSSVGTVAADRIRVLVVEDNSILRNLLVKWLKTKGYEYRDAVDGRDGVRVFESGGHFEYVTRRHFLRASELQRLLAMALCSVVLIDLSMPVLDGIGATAEIRQIEAARSKAPSGSEADARPARILALTGMSSLEDKRRAFEAGVDGYLVKPVAFKTLDHMFKELGISYAPLGEEGDTTALLRGTDSGAGTVLSNLDSNENIY
ncbi:hypothetical protein OE88DRAFT_1645701 [Heliocybe sulcata]|uniref:dolichol kinase n=1 Tax=Heliocybe sulcata TaxID=5364 RepID=A0A5C3N1I0_9AGAM|nr:hypothetical protein OE88DRAFT_1645701 [Heliocybe sulcata]